MARIQAGLALAQDGVTSYGPLGAEERSVQATQAAPFAAVGVGIDFYLSPLFALGGDARAIAFAFGRNPPPLEADDHRATKYGTQLGLMLAVTATLRPPI